MTVVEIFSEISCKTSSELGYGLNYDFGHEKDIVNKLNEINNTNAKAQAKKYPLIALIQPFTESSSDRRDVSFEIDRLNFVIATISKPEFYPDQRYQNNFTRLHAIRDEFIECIKRSKYLEFGYKEPSIESIDSWAKDRILTDYIDFISFSIINLKLRKFYCITQN